MHLLHFPPSSGITLSRSLLAHLPPQINILFPAHQTIPTSLYRRRPLIMSSLIKLPTAICCSSSSATTTTTRRSPPPPYYTHHLPSFHFDFDHLSFSSSSSSPPPPLFPSEHHRRPPVRVAYQGPRGSYCQEAAAVAFPASSSLYPCPSGLDGAFSALELHLADLALVPIENSLDGPIPRNLDLLLRHPDVRIHADIVLPVRHCLLSLPSSPPQFLRRVLAHPQAASHCRRRLESAGLEVLEVANAAEAARHLADLDAPDTAVIGSRAAADEFGLAVLRRDFQDDDQNYNRFLQLGLGEGEAGGEAEGRKTAVAFAMERGPSDLFRAMWAFECRGVRVNRVNHRPNRERPVRVVEDVNGSARRYLDYVFFLEVEGAESDPSVKAAIRQLKEVAGFVRVLGCYRTCQATGC